jgi:amidohydrolase
MTTVPLVGSGLLERARSIEPDVLDLRRRLHRIPEIGLDLPRTQRVVIEELSALGLEPVAGAGLGSVTAVIAGSRPGRTVLLRADMDGLPVTEDTGLEFASTIPGAMHACGHDIHVAMLIGAARLLLEMRAELPGHVLLMFQPGEEGHHGARLMLEEGLLDASGEMPAAAFALHISTRYPTGTINVRAGPMLVAADTFSITVLGRGGHASTPHLAVDPIAAAAAIVIGLQTMVGRRINAFDPAVVTVARIESGTTTNVIPETATLAGTIRSVSEATRSTVHTRIRELADGIAAAHGASAEVTIEPGYAVTRNDPAVVDEVQEVGRQIVGADEVITMDAPNMGAEDFSYVLQRVPGAMAFLGARPRDLPEEMAPQNHSNHVVFEELALAIGIAMHVGVALRLLGA